MNDFTKDELNQLMDACMYWFECPDDGILKEAQILVGKIQSMIDDYCEHDWNDTGAVRIEVECKKCGAKN